MSKHTFSAFTSDISRNPSILSNMVYEAAVQTGFQVPVKTTEHGAVTTVTAVTA